MDFEISSKKEAFEFFERQISRAYYKLYESQKLEFESYLLKSFILEKELDVNLDEADELRQLLSFEFKGETVFPTLRKIEDDFWEVLYPVLSVRMYLEKLDDRFFAFHTLSESKKVDLIVQKLVSQHHQIDAMWLWHQFLDRQLWLNQRSFKGFSFDYDFRKISGDESDQTLSYLKMQIWGGGHEIVELYKKLRSMLRNKATLAKVRFKEFGDNPEHFVLTDIKFLGKFRSHGTDVRLHRKILFDVKTAYAQKLATIEKKYRLSWQLDGQREAVLEGEPLYFKFSKRIDYLDRLIEVVFNGSYPFRLLGFVQETNHGYFIRVVDLHVGSRFNLELYPDLMVVYLPEDVCGNTVIRFYTNLQHTMETEVVVEDAQGEKVF